MGVPKAELALDGERLVDRAVRVLTDGGCDDVVAVIRPGVDVAGARVAVNADPERGMRSSLELAVDAAGDADVIVLVLVDLPGLGSDAVRAVIGGWRPGRIVTARYAARRGEARRDGLARRGHPIAMSPALWRAALELAGDDEGARALLRARPELVDEIDVTGDPQDLDTPADLQRWRDSG
jgi:molybdenum cofactor cytidylyltransferase/nicotine blue oxidoreductase